MEENLLKIIKETMNIVIISNYNKEELKKVLDILKRIGAEKIKQEDCIGKGSNSTVFKIGDYVIKIRK